jgi:hypothetical protein
MIPIPNQGAFTAANIAAILANMQAVLGVTGNVYYLDPKNGLDTNNGSYPTNQGSGNGPVKTLAVGYALLANGKNDVLILIADGTTASTVRISAGFTWSKSAAHFVGMCSPSFFSQRARIAPPTTAIGFANFFTVSGNGCYFRNLQWFQGFAAGIAAEICMTVTGSRNTFENCSFTGMADTDGGSGADTGSRDLKITAGENFFKHCTIGTDTIARTVANASIEFAGGCARNVFEDCLIALLATVNTVLGVKALTGGIDRFQLFERCKFINAINSSGVSMTGLGSIGANGGGPNGTIVYRDSMLVGIAEWEQTTKTSVYVSGPANSTSTGIAANPA